MDQSPIDGLYRSYGPSVLRRARSLLGSESAAWDALHEVFVRALHNLEVFRGESSPMTWLYRITTNYCLNLLRDLARREARVRAHAITLSPISADDPELRLTLAKLLACIPSELCEVAIYHYVDRMTHDEIAEVIGVSRRTVGNYLREFREQAQQVLGGSFQVST